MFVVADATGHGIGPALVIAETRAMLRAICLQGADVPTVLRTTNSLLNVDLESGRFVTCFFGLLSPQQSKLIYASAGHGPMVFYNRKSDTFEKVSATSIPLGVLDESDYTETITYTFETGDFAVILTDGFFEAANLAGEDYGMDRVTDLLRIGRDTPPDVMIEMLYAGVCEFAAGQPQADDLTAIVIRKL